MRSKLACGKGGTVQTVLPLFGAILGTTLGLIQRRLKA
jgi:hypothetical protein